MYHVFNKHMNTVYTDPDTYARAMGWKGDLQKGIDRAKIGGDPSVRSTDYGETSKEFLMRKIDEEFTLLSRESGVGMTPRALKDQAAYGKGMFDNGEGGLRDLSGGPRNSSGQLSAIGDVRDLHVRVISARMLIQNTAADVNTVAIKLFEKRQLLLAKGQDISAKEQLQFAEMLTRQLTEIDMLAQIKTASGRNLRAFQDLDKIEKYAASLNPEQEEEIYKQLLATLESSEGFSKVLAQLDVIVQQTKDAPTMGGRAAYTNALNRAKILRASTGWNDLIKAHNDIWINSLLFNGQTQVVNFVSTGINIVAGNVERYVGSFAPESWFKNQRDIYGEEMSAATAKQVARSHAMYESSYITGVSWDILNLLFRGSDNFKASADSSRLVADTKAAFKNPEDDLLGGTHLDNQLRSGGEAQSQHIGAALTNIGYRVGGATGRAVEMLGENKGTQTVAVLWDGFYKHYLRGGARFTVAADQFFKRMTMQASAQGSLTSYAIEVKGMTNKKEIAEWVAERKTGLMLPNNQPFSEVNLRKLAQKTARDNGITNKEEHDAYVKWFVAKNTNFEGPDGRIVMTGPLREEMASKALDASEQYVFQQGLNRDMLALHIQAGGTEKNFGKIDPITGAPYTPYGPTISGRIADLTNRVPLFKLVLPFVKTPVNLWKAMINRVPYLSKFAKQSLSDLRSGDPQRVAQVYGRQLTGMALFGGSFELVRKGAVTGDLSNNPARRATEFAAGLRPWTITDSNGEKWNYSRMEWAATPLKIMAQYHETMEYLRNDPAYEEQWLDWGHAGIGTIASVGVDSTYLRGMSEFLNLVRNMSSGDTQDSSKELMDAAAMRLGSYVPKIPKDFMDAMDDTYRKHSRAGDALLVRIFPFGVPPLRDPITGRVIKKHRSYPHPLIHMITPVKRYSHNVSSFIAQEMVSLNSFIQPIGKEMFENPKLKMHEAYANFDGPTREMTAELRKKGADYKLPEHLGGAKCPVVGGQDYYDFLQQYISVRKVEFKNIGLINSSITVPAQDGENGARIAQLFADIKDNKKLSVKASLEDIIHTVVQMESYQAIPIDAGVGKVSYRATIIQGIVSKFRSDSKAELLGNVIDIGTKYDPIEGKTGVYLPVYTGIINSFWPELSKQASKENYQNLWKHQGKNVFESPANKSKQLQRINEETFGRPTPIKKK